MVSIVIAGDFCPPFDIVKKYQDGTAHIEMPESVIKGADYAVVNLETPLTDNDYKPIFKWGPNIKRPTSSVEILKQCGFNLVTLANNHIMDYGEKALAETVDLCVEHGIDTVGAGKGFVEASKTYYKQIGSVNVAFINCCEHEFSIASDNNAGTNALNPINQYYAIKEAKEKADYVIVIVHGGREGMRYPSPRMVETYRFFVDAGADAVINHHQHVFNGYEVYHDRPIFYGLGNFYMRNSNWPHKEWTKGYMVKLILENGVNFELYPYIQCDNNESVLLMENKHKFESEIEEMNKVIVNYDLLRKRTEEKYDRMGMSYLRMLSPYPQKKFWIALFAKRVLPSFLTRDRIAYASNIIDNESHRDIISYLLFKEMKK